MVGNKALSGQNRPLLSLLCFSIFAEEVKMIRKRIKNKIKNFELLKKKEGKKLANIGVITLLLLSVLSTLFLPYASPAFTADEVVTDDFTGSNWNVTGNVVHNATGGYIWVKSDYGAGLKEGNAWWYPQYHSYPITNLTLQVNYTGEIDQTGSNLGSNEIFINITLTNETGTTTSSPQVMVHRADFDATYNETYTWNVVDIYQYRYVNISFYMAATATTDNLAWATVRWLKLSLDTNSKLSNNTLPFTADYNNAIDDKILKTWSQNGSAFGWMDQEKTNTNFIYDVNDNSFYVFYSDYTNQSAHPHICVKKYWLNNNTWSAEFQFNNSLGADTYPVGQSWYTGTDTTGQYYENHIRLNTWLDNYNHIYVMYGGHATVDFPMTLFRSTVPISSLQYNNVSQWERMGNLSSATGSCYHQEQYVPSGYYEGYIMNCYRIGSAGGSDYFAWSSNNGTSWTTRLISYDAAYGKRIWKYDDVNDKWLFFRIPQFQDWDSNFHFYWATIDDIVNGTGLRNSSSDIGDPVSYTFPVTSSTIPSGIDNWATSSGFGGIEFDPATRRVYALGINSTGALVVYSKILGTTANWTQYPVYDNSTVISSSGSADMQFVNNGEILMITLPYNVSGTYYWKILWSGNPLGGLLAWNIEDVTINGTSDVSSYENSFCPSITTFDDDYLTVIQSDVSKISSIGGNGLGKTPKEAWWTYIDDRSNHPPYLTGINPSNGATNISRSPILSVYISDIDGNLSTCYIYTSSDSVNWTLQQTYTNILNSTISYSYTSANQYNTTYYWKVVVNDTTYNISQTYSFTTSASATGFDDSGTAEPMTFPDTLPNSGQWVNATSNLLVIANDYGTIDGTNSWIKLQSAIMYNETNDEIIYAGTNGIRLYARINDGSWHNITARDANGYYIVNDSVWNYTFDIGDTMTIKEEVYIQNCTGCDPAGYYTSYYMNKYYPGFWQVVNATSNITSLNYWNATITLTDTGNTPPTIPNTPDPANGATDVTVNNPSLSFHTGDTDSNYLQCSLYLNDSLVNSKYVENLTSNMTISIIVPQILEAGKTYSWYVKVSDGTDTVTGPVWQFTTANATSNQAPLVYSPFPTNGATNISLLPTLSVLVYDTDSDSISVTFYDSNNITIGIDTFVNQMPPSPGQASVQWNNVILSNHTYQWYAVADDGDGNVVRYPTTGYLNFTTGISYPPVVTFQVKDTSGFPLSDVNISCSNLNQQILQYATTNTGGFASFSFNYNDIGQTYDFVFKKTNYTTVKKTYTISTGQYYITLQYRATPTGDDTTNPTDIATIFVNYAQGSLGTTGLAFLSIILVILAMLIASKQFNTGNITTLFIGASLFGLFIAIGWLPFWLLLLPFVIVALMFGGKIRDMIFGKSTGGDES